MHTLCRLHGPFSAEVYKYSTRKHLHVHFLFFFVFFLLVVRFLFTYEISTDGLSLMYWILDYRFCSSMLYHTPEYIGTAFSPAAFSPARQVSYVTSHMYHSQSRLIACVPISVSLPSNQPLVCFLHTSTAVWIRLGFSFQIRIPGLYTTVLSPVVINIKNSRVC